MILLIVRVLVTGDTPAPICILHASQLMIAGRRYYLVSFYRASYASAVLGVVILSVRLSVTRVLCD